MKKIVIVVDDSEMIRNMMTNALEDEYTVIQAVDGRDAIDKMTQYNSIACMLLDFFLPLSFFFSPVLCGLWSLGARVRGWD